MLSLAASLILLVEQEAPKSDPVLDALTYLIRHQGVDGSWGGRPAPCTCKQEAEAAGKGDLETTAWAILAFSGAGYTELAKDEFGDRAIGPALSSAVEWLLSKQDKEGAFDRENVETNALADLALFEIYYMTIRHREAAEKGFAWVRASKPASPLARIRTGMAWESAMLGDLTNNSKEALRDLATVLERGPSEFEKAGGLLLRTFAEHPKRAPGVRIDYAAGDPLKLSPEECNVLTVAWFQGDAGSDWHAWYKLLRTKLSALQCREGKVCERGSWSGLKSRERLRTTAIRALTLEHYRCNFCQDQRVFWK